MTNAAPMHPGTPRMLVLRALGLGDLCTAIPALRGLRRRLPDHHMSLATPGELRALVELADVVDDVVDQADLERPLPLAARGPDLAVNLHGRGPQSTRLLEQTRPTRLVAFAAHPGRVRAASGPRWHEAEHEVDRWCRLVASVGAVCDRTDVLLRRPTRETVFDPPGIVVHPGAAAAARRWPAERFAAVIRSLIESGHRVTITGAAAEANLAADVVRRAGAAGDPACVVAAGRTDIEALARLVADAELVLAGDTGVAHLATAFATPSVLLFGPTAPSRWGPTTAGPHEVLWTGCVGDPHGSEPDPGLREIAPDDVLDAITRSFGGRVRQRRGSTSSR